MPVIASYASEYALAQWLASRLDAGIATLLGWALGTNPQGPGSYQESINQALRLYGLGAGQTITSATNAGKLEAAARLAMWQHVNDLLPSYVDQTMPDGLGASLSEMVTNAGVQLKRARVEALRYGLGGYHIGRRAITNVYDPYTSLDDSERVIP